MAEELVIEVRKEAQVEGETRPSVGVYARVGNRPVVRIWMPAEDATDAGKCVPELLNAGLQFFDRPVIKQRLAEALKNVRPSSAVVAVRSGWHGRCFVFNGEIHKEKNSADFFLHQELRRKHIPYPEARNDELIDFVDEAATKSDFVAAATMIAFAQPLLGLLPSPERPVIYFGGESRTGKTTLAALINGITRPPSDRQLQPFDSTPRAFEEALQYCSDNVAVFDELNSLDVPAIEQALSPFIYTAANGRGKSRSKGANFPNLRWCTTAVLTGEVDLDTLKARRKGSGQDARLMTIAVPLRRHGGIWPSSWTEDERAKQTDELSALIATYSGHSYLKWIKRLVKNQDEIKARFARNVSAYIEHLAGAGADSLVRSTAARFAQLAASGDELIRACVVDWEKTLPIEAISRLYQAACASKGNTTAGNDTARQSALTILAHVGLGHIPCGKAEGDINNTQAFISHWDGEQLVMIEKGSVSRFTGVSEVDVVSAFRALGSNIASGSTPYFQDRKLGKRFLRVPLATLERIAFAASWE
ncbi:hypothetical protein J2X76_002233 [Neorhizobium sp. 2083]|uniref:DUF927 domain-containing protein n=1 Tax=Neorhizobium sp. 2083 TaxID=2817762 RepID=UPI0013AFDE21|nr:DUF927 domain-containing protein [Neorhizobium sp. 2083]MDR6817060.1 hypothetical protein [Neorhizobium sp. 2083]